MAVVYANDQSPQSSGNVVYEDDGTDWGGVVKDALNEASMGNGSKMRDLMTNPVTQAKALPYLAGGLGLIGIGGGSAVNTAGAHLLSDAALKSYGRSDQIPPLLETSKNFPYLSGQIPDVALAAVGDAVNSKIASKQIGSALTDVGVKGRAPLQLPTPANTGKMLDDMETTLNHAIKTGQTLGPQSAQDMYTSAKYIMDNSNLIGKSKDIAAQAARVRSLASQMLNQAVPERAAPALRMAVSNTVPNAVSTINKSTPWWLKAGASIVGLDALKDSLLNRRKP